LPGPTVSWVDEHLLIVARGSTTPSGRA